MLWDFSSKIWLSNKDSLHYSWISGEGMLCNQTSGRKLAKKNTTSRRQLKSIQQKIVLLLELRENDSHPTVFHILESEGQVIK